jgi:hypothetical protein
VALAWVASPRALVRFSALGMVNASMPPLTVYLGALLVDRIADARIRSRLRRDPHRRRRHQAGGSRGAAKPYRVLLQDYASYELSIRENVMMGRPDEPREPREPREPSEPKN